MKNRKRLFLQNADYSSYFGDYSSVFPHVFMSKTAFWRKNILIIAIKLFVRIKGYIYRIITSRFIFLFFLMGDRKYRTKP